ncbi:MAG: SDR family oxidoreductase [Bacteroidota bacterium]|jgi:NAD(P)-dependent dehydrogenase (short-subunit alcohol dehydrogenase family)
MQTYLIVGASSGIGFQLAKNLTEKGNKVIALSRNNNELTNLNNVTFYQVDISEETPTFPVIEESINGLIYCPGTINLKPFRAIKPEDYINEFNINALGAVKTIKQYLPNLTAAGNGNIVLFSTVAVQNGMPFHSSIAMAKGAVEGLTRSLAAEFAPKIRVNAVAPSLTATPLADKLINAEAKLKGAEERHPLKKIGNVEDMSQAVEYLLNANWVTGQIVHVDGGMSAIR